MKYTLKLIYFFIVAFLLITLAIYMVFFPHHNLFTRTCSSLNNQPFTFQRLNTLKGYCAVDETSSITSTGKTLMYRSCTVDHLDDYRNRRQYMNEIWVRESTPELTETSWFCIVKLHNNIMKTEVWYGSWYQ